MALFLLACAPGPAVVAPVRPAGAGDLDAADVYRRMLATYAAMPSLLDEGAIVTTGYHEHDYLQHLQTVDATTKSYAIAFTRPRQYRFRLATGSLLDAERSTFLLVRSNQVRVADEDKPSAAIARERWTDDALPFDRESEGTSTFYWRLLNGLDPLGPPTDEPLTVRRIDRELVGPRLCDHLIVTRAPIELELWLEEDTLLVRKIQRRALERRPQWKHAPMTARELEQDAAHRATMRAHYRAPLPGHYLEVTIVSAPRPVAELDGHLFDPPR